MSNIPPHGYPQIPFSQADWNAAQTAQYFQMQIPGYSTYDFLQNTSSGSDESMNCKTDPKMSPKYREKRQKNNEAAKKSRKQRKERELGYQLENQELRAKNKELTAENQEAMTEVNKLKNALNEVLADRDNLKKIVDNLLQNSMENPIKYAAHHNGLRDVTNANHFAEYQSL